MQVSQARLEGILLDKKSRRKKQEPVLEAPDFELQNPIPRCSHCRNSYPADFPLCSLVSCQSWLLHTSRAPCPTWTGSSSTDPSWVSRGLCSPPDAAGVALPFAHCSCSPVVLLCLWPHRHLPKSSSQQMFLQMCSLQRCAALSGLV